MAILKLAPALKDYLWGGQRLKEEFGIVNIVNLFRPQMMMEDQCFGGKYGKIPQIATAKLGKEAGIIDAANL
ncbi:MAG: hypothetical protein IJ136_01385 [Erysipelotrichaceae bacterium]|nr:hypothetical protein [Erysipelotrichaceae bacterium]